MGFDTSDISRFSKRAQQQILAALQAKEIEKQVKREKEKNAAKKNKGGANKYKAKKVESCLEDGTPFTFASTKEFDRYRELVCLQRAGKISDLKLQVTYPLIPKQNKKNGKAERGISYVADFAYTENGETVVEDVKGYRNPASAAYRVFTMKRKLMLFFHGIEIREI